MRQLSSLLGRLTLVVCAVSLSTACSSGGTGSRAREAVVHVTTKDFRIVLRPKHVPAGEVRIELTNDGPVTHELIIARRRSNRLPLRRDELTVDEDALRPVGTIEGLGPGHVERLSLHLAPGRYQLFCNMAGHFLAGMHAELVVK
jgi:uncharacterized cupredoxin-like copper-binding protein